MNGMTLDLARLLVEDRLGEAQVRRQRRAARRAATPAGAVEVPRQRRAAALMDRLVPGYGVHVPTR
jgi:hypothetical protein